MTEHRSSTETIIGALKVLSHDIETDDVVINSCLWEAAERLMELNEKYKWQPIETTPKDKRILIALEDKSVVVGSFSEMCQKFWNEANAEFIDSNRTLLGWMELPTFEVKK